MDGRRRRALVTGAGGIARAVAARLVTDGVSVTLFSRTRSRLDEAVSWLEPHATAGAEVAAIAGDAAVEDEVRAAVAAAAGAGGELHHLVTTVGAGRLSSLMMTDGGAFVAGLTTNLTTAYLAIRHAVPAMARAGGGSIVAVSSITATTANRYQVAYSPAKAGLEQLVRVVAHEVGHLGIRVNSVRPGVVLSHERASVLFDRTGWTDRTLLPGDGWLSPDDIAGPQAGGVTGQSIAVDLGVLLGGVPDFEAAVRELSGDDAVAHTRSGILFT